VVKVQFMTVGNLITVAREQRAIGEVWATSSNGKALFCMPSGTGFGELRGNLGDARAQ